VSVAVLRISSDALLVGDSRPSPLNSLGGSIGLGLPIAWGITLAVEGQVSGTWYDFNNGADDTGNITVLAPGVRAGVEHGFEISGALDGELEAGFEYSEVRSWTHSKVLFLPYDVTGPRNFRRGGVL
jgi:hypothetical protein